MPSHLAMTVGNVQIIAVTDMSFPFPMPVDQLWPEVPAEAWDTLPTAISRHLP